MPMSWSRSGMACLIVAVFGTASLLAADLSVTTVVFNGRQVFMGSTGGTVSSKAGSSNGIELAAVYDDDRVIWENVPGAGQFLRGAGAYPAASIASPCNRQNWSSRSAGNSSCHEPTAPRR
jgi:hypothetical protein